MWYKKANQIRCHDFDGFSEIDLDLPEEDRFWDSSCYPSGCGSTHAYHVAAGFAPITEDEAREILGDDFPVED